MAHDEKRCLKQCKVLQALVSDNTCQLFYRIARQTKAHHTPRAPHAHRDSGSAQSSTHGNKSPVPESTLVLVTQQTPLYTLAREKVLPTRLRLILRQPSRSSHSSRDHASAVQSFMPRNKWDGFLEHRRKSEAAPAGPVPEPEGASHLTPQRRAEDLSLPSGLPGGLAHSCSSLM